MATDKKTPLVAAPISCSSMRAASYSFPTSAAPGRPEGRRRACSTVTGTTGSRSAAAWRCRPNTGGWRCTCAASPGISPGSTFGPSSGTCFGISVARSFSCGIVARSIGGARSGLSSRLTHAWTSMSSPRTRPSSTRRSTSGRRPIAPWRTALPTTSPSYASDWTLPPAASAARNASSGPASMLPISRGPDEPRSFRYLCETQ
jgi:hypothetical protein